MTVIVGAVAVGETRCRSLWGSWAECSAADQADRLRRVGAVHPVDPIGADLEAAVILAAAEAVEAGNR